MNASMLRASRPARRGAALLLLSVMFHALLLAALALHMPAMTGRTDPAVMAVSLVPASYVGASPAATSRAETRAHRPRVVWPASPHPRYAVAVAAPTGEAADAVDLFGPVFADGLWPRPVKVGRVPCDADALGRDPDCRRDVMLIGLASRPPARSNAGP